MIKISTFQDLARLREYGHPESVARYVKELFEQMFESFNTDSFAPEAFSLEHHGALHVAEQDFSIESLLQSSPFGLEYAERVELEDMVVYRIGVTLDNDLIVQYIVPSDLFEVTCEPNLPYVCVTDGDAR